MVVSQRHAFGPLGPWIAPGVGLGLVAAGGAMALGMSSGLAPTVAVVVTALVLLVKKLRLRRRESQEHAPAER